MSRKSQEEVIRQLFQENQVWHREIMGIVTNQALDAILAQQIIEQIFAFAPAPPRPYSQCPRSRFPSAASRGSFLGAVTASTGYRRPPTIPAARAASSLRSPMPIVLPEPGSATMTCQLLWSHA